jgi:hypothetical protein
MLVDDADTLVQSSEMFLGFDVGCADLDGDGFDDLVTGRGEINASPYVADFELAEDEQLELFPTQPTAPDSNPKTRFGMAKPPLSLIPATALVHMAEGFRDGAAKYGPANWRKDPVSTSTYLNAAYRHIAAWQDGEECDPVSGVHHLGHAADCLAILMDAQACATLLDDRPPAAPTGDLIRAKTQPLT